MITGRRTAFALAVASLVLTQTAPSSATATSVLPHGNGTWTYDSTRAGQWAGRITDYDTTAADGHALTIMMSYATDLEMYCPDDDPAQCTPDDLYSYYTPGSNGRRSTAAYAADVPGAVVEPIIDGVVDSDYLAGFNQLSPDLARAFADKVATQVCSDPLVAGIQFDLEPFDVRTKNGQFFFYREIAKAFAGGTCVDGTHPQGRFFSIFTFASSIRPGTSGATNLASIVNRFSNGYVIDSLYDLGTRPGGWLTTPSGYRPLVTTQVTQLKAWADQLGIPYGYGLPGGASAHEYTTCTGGPCHHGASAQAGYPMQQYTSRALDAIDASGARDDPLFLGDYLWYFGQGPQHHPGYDVTPAPVTAPVLALLSRRL